MRVKFLLLLLSMFAVMSAHANKRDNSALVQKYIDYFNQQNIDAMIQMTHDDIAWYYVSQGNIHLEAKGKIALRQSMSGYFKQNMATKSTLIESHQHGQFVQGIEKATWTKQGKTRSQCSAVTYQFDQGLIRNVWYFDAYSC